MSLKPLVLWLTISAVIAIVYPPFARLVVERASISHFLFMPWSGTAIPVATLSVGTAWILFRKTEGYEKYVRPLVVASAAVILFAWLSFFTFFIWVSAKGGL